MHLGEFALIAYVGASTLYLVRAKEPFEVLEHVISAERSREEEPDLWEVVDSEHHSLDKLRVSRLKGLVGIGFKMSLHCPYDPWINIADKEPARRKQSMNRVKESIDAAAELEAVSFNLHPGTCMGFEEDKRIMSILNSDAITSLFDYAYSRGVLLSVENMPPNQGYFLVTPQEFLTIEEERGLDLKVTLDPGHANLAGLVDDFLRTLGERVSEVHVHDNKGELDEHLAVGLGSIDWLKIVREVCSRSEMIYFVAETYEHPFKSVAWLKEKTSTIERQLRFTRGI